MKATILLIDDEQQLRQLLSRIIRFEGFIVEEVSTIGEARKWLQKVIPDIILCDVKLPDGNGVEMVKEFKARYPGSEVILLTAYGNIADGVQAMRNGAFDYITKGDDNDRIIPLLHRAYDKILLSRKVVKLQEQIAAHYTFESLQGRSAAILSAIEMAKKVAATHSTVLLLGETGTGKEIFAQAIHYTGPRRSGPFVAVNCSALSKELLENELFGHKAGAYTGAISDKKGLFEEADGGTIFLDEIGEMSTELQAKLLRVLESGEFIKVGDTKTINVNVRIIAATNRDLLKEIETGHFRSDLYYRLSVFQINLPPLRERIQDIELLAKQFVAVFAGKTNKPQPALHKEYLLSLAQYHWPGNIRELKNIIERSIILDDDGELTMQDLPAEFQKRSSSANRIPSFELSVMERAHIQKVLKHTAGNKTEAARLLGIGLTTLYRKIEEYGL